MIDIPVRGNGFAAAGLAALVAAGCGSRSPPVATAPPGADRAATVEVAAAVQPFAFMLGSWRTADGTSESWHAAGDALFGVGFAHAGFECAILAEQEGVITYRAMPGGQVGVDFPVDDAGAGWVRFVNPDHDFPQAITYQRDGAALTATISRLDGSDPVVFRYRQVDPVAAPALVEADARFAADTARDRAAGWASWFDPAGAMLRPTGRIEGRPAIEEAVTGLFSDPGRNLEWQPVASGLAPSGQLGFTVGNARLVDAGKVTWQGAYVTIWRRQADGTWRVLFDTGDDA